MKNWILCHRKLLTATIIGSAIILILAGSLISMNVLPSEFEIIEVLYYMSQIVSAIFVISGVVIAVWQYYLSYVDSKRNKDLICVQKAIDLSDYYKDNILLYMAPIQYIYDNSGISDIISKIKKNEMKHFDKKELDLYLSSDDFKSLKEIQKSNKFFETIIKANSIYNLGLSADAIKYFEENKEKPIEDSEILSTFLGRLIIRTLNNMEYFALHFTHNVADQSVVYKSLHQTYIDMVQMFYYTIAKSNPLQPSKYFTNIIELYEIWNSKALKDEENFANGVRSLSNKGTVVDEK